jgi:hypothetical protein
MRNKFTFNRIHKEFEPIYDASSFNKTLVEEYKMKELSRNGGINGGTAGVSGMNKLVYNCNDVSSTYYTSAGEYLKSED